jgi:TetR/AcrR family transcriptional repressor of mexJK operon
MSGDLPHPAPSGPRAERKRRDIIAAARALFLRDGFGVGMDAIAAAAGVSKVTVYNHFRSKEALFTAVVAGALDEPLTATDATAPLAGLTEAADLRGALTEVARSWVRSVRDNEDVIALRALVAAEQHRFPELGDAWRRHGPTGHHPEVAEALRTLHARGRLAIGDVEVAVLQLYALFVFPHLVVGQYGTALDDEATEKLLDAGVGMFLAYYATGPAGDV